MDFVASHPGDFFEQLVRIPMARHATSAPKTHATRPQNWRGRYIEFVLLVGLMQQYCFAKMVAYKK